MFAILGDNIVFEVVKLPETLSDKRTTNYAQIPLVTGKPNLQRTGEALIELSMQIKFLKEFCDPEEEFLKLDSARSRGEVLPFIFANGRNEGDFVITTIERTWGQTDGEGNFIEMDCNISLLEFANISTASKQLEQDKKNAFARSSNRPLPANRDVSPTNPALSVSKENLKVQQSTYAIDEQAAKVETDVSLVTNIDPNQELIDKAQKFVDSFDVFIPKVNKQVTESNNALGSINSLIGAHASITGESPTLPTKITAVQTSLTGVSTQLTVLGSLPAIIGNVTDAGTALAAMTNMLLAVKTLKDNSEALNSANAAIVKAVATKKVMT